MAKLERVSTRRETLRVGWCRRGRCCGHLSRKARQGMADGAVAVWNLIMRIATGNRIRMAAWNARKWLACDPYDAKRLWLRQTIEECSPGVLFLFEMEGSRPRSNRPRPLGGGEGPNFPLWGPATSSRSFAHRVGFAEAS